jgi:hypothetical protein
MTTATQVELFPALPARTVKPSVREQWNAFRKDFDRMGGMLPPSAAGAFLGVSRQRVHQLIQKKQVRTVRYEDVGLWVSLEDIVQRMVETPNKGGRPKKSS